jgi:hypothetical protein
MKTKSKKIKRAQCRNCGCTEHRACQDKGGNCHWVAPDLCSSCSPGCLLHVKITWRLEQNVPYGEGALWAVILRDIPASSEARRLMEYCRVRTPKAAYRLVEVQQIEKVSDGSTPTLGIRS